MNKAFKEYDKEARRILYIKTENFNKMLADANAAVRVVPHDVEIRNQYNAYLHDCEVYDEEPLSEYEYGKAYGYCRCSFETRENADAGLLMAKALGVKTISVKYAEDYFGRMTDDELELYYKA